jgi:hypothetical protein
VEEEEADNKAIAERLAALNKVRQIIGYPLLPRLTVAQEFDDKIAAIDAADKKDEDEFNAKLAELQKVGA